MTTPVNSLSRLRASLVVGSPLAMRLADEMASCWRRGERPGAEEFLGRDAGLWEQPEVALQLVYEEICLREESGEEGAAEAVTARFPQWREQLDALLECHRLLAGPPGAAPPEVGETLGEFRLLALLGRGAAGGVFLAVQPALADRPVVLKVTPRAGHEHLSLARLQHSHIVPLYAARDEPSRDLRLLCMPYFGGASLARLLELLAEVPQARRTGRHLLDALDRAQADSPIPVPPRGPGRDRLARSDYVESLCWVGACLADALHYAHERGLVHLDLKPANVLIAADGTPMLLDFHLAREPLRPGAPVRGWLGGTPVYMAPEQARAMRALERGEPVPNAVDRRADVYALGLMLRHALGGSETPGDPRRGNPAVSRGLADVLGRCLAEDPERRYASAEALADDLRRHLAHLPLRGVPNRSLAERLRKWRRRRPHALSALGVFLAVAGLLALAADHARRRYGEPRAALREGLAWRERGEPARALEVLEQGRARAEALPFGQALARELEDGLAAARRDLAARRRAELARDLHALAERIRFASVLDPLPAAQARDLEKRCRAVWEARPRLFDPAEGLDDGPRADLLDVAVIGAQLQARHAPPEARPSALALLDEAEALCGPSLALDLERARLGGPAARAARAPRTAWEHVLLGRSLLRAAEVAKAAEQFAAAIERSPGDFWAHFYHGVCAYRLGRHRLAAERFGVCAALSPRSAACYHNRALAREALGQKEGALADYGRALDLDPAMVAAALNRGLLHARDGRRAEARRDLEHALRHGVGEEARELLERLRER